MVQSFNELLRTLLQEYKPKESCKAHQSNTRVDCESDILDDEGKENNSDMNSNSVILRTESNKDYSESIISQETSPAVQKHLRSSKTAILDFLKLKELSILIVTIMLLSNIFWLEKV